MAQKTILVVDDDPKIRTLLRNVMEGEGLAVSEAANAEETLAQLTASRPDLITLDINLGADNGLEVARAIRAISQVPIIMVSGRKSAIEKVASFLCVLIERMSTELGPHNHALLPMSRSDIADFLGLTTETVSRTLSQLRKSGIIAINNVHTVVALQPQALFALSQGHGGPDPDKSVLHGMARAG